MHIEACHQLLRKERSFICELTGKKKGGKARICLFSFRIWGRVMKGNKGSPVFLVSIVTEVLLMSGISKV